MAEAVVKWGEVDYLVVGSSPGGLWLLSQLPGIASTTIRIGWLGAVEATRPLFVPQVAADRFQLAGSRPAASEILWNEAGIAWKREEIRRHFPELKGLERPGAEELKAFKPNQWSRGTPGADRLRDLREGLARYPELMGFANAFWKVFGRTDSVSPEIKLWSLLHAAELNRWHPAEGLPETIERFAIDDTSGIESIRQTPDGLWEVRVAEKGTLHCRYLILSASARELASLSRAFQGGSPPWAGVVAQPLARAIYPFSVVLEKGAVPHPMRDLTLLMDSLDIPEPDTEIWPIEKEETADATRLHFWVSGRYEDGVDSLSPQFKQAVKRLNRLLPFSARRVKQFQPSLEWEECSDGERRRATHRSLQRFAWERFPFSLMEPRTRWRTLFFVGPYFYTHWPYPLGELWAAEVVKGLLIGERKGIERKLAKRPEGAEPVALQPPSG